MKFTPEGKSFAGEREKRENSILKWNQEGFGKDQRLIENSWILLLLSLLHGFFSDGMGLKNFQIVPTTSYLG